MDVGGRALRLKHYIKGYFPATPKTSGLAVRLALLALAAWVVVSSLGTGLAYAQEDGDLNCDAPGNRAKQECNNSGGTDPAGFNIPEPDGDSTGERGSDQGASEGGGSGADESGTDESGGDESGERGSGGSQPDENLTESAPDTGAAGEEKGLTGMVLGFFKGILSWVFDSTIGWAIDNMADTMSEDLLPLPEPKETAVGFYEDTAETMRPAILVGILILGLMMMLRTQSYDMAYASFSGLPRLVGVGIALAFLPVFMDILTGLATGISQEFFPKEGQINNAASSLFKAALTNMLTMNFLNIILMIMLAVVGFLVILTAFLKNIFFLVLFIAAPFALVGSLIPGCQQIAGAWFRGMLACALIPSFWAIELGVGSFIVQNPEAIFGGMAEGGTFLRSGAVTTIGAILILWLMYKTPFKILEWAFQSYGSGGGTARSLIRGAMFAVGTQAIRGGMHALGAGGSGGSGGSRGSAAGGAGGTSGQKVQTLGQMRNEQAKMNKGMPKIQMADRNANALEKFKADDTKKRAFGMQSHAPGTYHGSVGGLNVNKVDYHHLGEAGNKPGHKNQSSRDDG